jgi:diguanylate cyclase (GGDEF)-like protein
MNYHDYLTGLYNRIYFEEMKIKMNREDCLPISFVLWNINGVRLINDAFGYNEGNLVICEVSKILQSCCRPGDILARTGGDEFALLLPNTNTETAREMMEIVSGAVADYNEKNKSKLYEITLSVGHATKDTAAGDLEETSKLADEYLRNRKLLDGNSSHSDIISSVMATMYERSQETEEHAKRLAAFSKGVGEKLNLSQKSLGELQLLAMLHDIGKVGIDDRVLNKPGKLDKAEWAVMKKHPEIGYRIVKSTSELEPIAEYILTHHEHWDGKGYPRGLKGENIPLLSRIIAVVDAYDAMTVDRVYRKAMTKEQALEEIKRNSGTQFDPEVAKIFIEYLS